MKKLLFLLLPLHLFAQDKPELATALIPAELSKNANAVIRDEVVNFNVSSPGRATMEVEKIVTIFNKNSRYNYILVHYNSYHKLGKIKGRVYDANGKLIRSLRKSEIRDESAISGFSIYEDDRRRYIEVNQSEYPYTVEFEYSIAYKDILGYPSWSVSEYSVGVEQASLVIALPSGFGLSYEALNVDVEPEVHVDGDKEEYVWQVSNLPPIKKERYAPGWSELLPHIRVSPGKFEADGYEGSMANWKDFGRFFRTLNNGRDKLSPEMKKVVHDLTADATSEREKIDRLYHYLQQNMRYVSVQLGIGGWQPFDAEYVEKNKYGDCKALSNFMMAMLKEAGITSYPTLIYAGDLEYDIHEDFACDAFNHVLLHVPEENYWLECTSSNTPPNYLGSGTDDRNVLLITEEGGVVARTPKLGPEQNVEANELTVVLEKTGAARLEMNSNRKGSRQEYYRYAVNNLSSEELQEKFQQNIPLSSFKLTEFNVVSNPDLPEAKIHCQAEVPRFASKAGKRLFVPLNPLNAFTDIPAAAEERVHPIVQRRGFSETDRIIFALPDGYEVESMPSETIEIDSEQAKYTCKVTADEKTVIVERSLTFLPCRLPAEAYDAWREVYKKIAKADNAKLVLVEKRT